MNKLTKKSKYNSYKITKKTKKSYKINFKTKSQLANDFGISLRTFQGGIEFSEYHGICSPAYNILRPSSDEVDRTFYKFYLKTSFYIRQLQKNLEGIRDGKMISYKYFSEIKVPSSQISFFILLPFLVYQNHLPCFFPFLN